jgi:hypothetical protein
LFEEVEGVEEGVCVGEEVVALREGFRASGLLGEDEGRYYLFISICHSIREVYNLQAPPASLGAVFKQLVHSFDEHGMSCRR